MAHYKSLVPEGEGLKLTSYLLEFTPEVLRALIV